MMAESDVDSWYDWKGGGEFNEMPQGKIFEIPKGIGLFGSSPFDNTTSDDSQQESSRSNGFVRYHAIPTSSRSGPEVRFINPAIYTESLEQGDDERELKIRLKINPENGIGDRRCNGQIVEPNCGDSNEMGELMSKLSIKNDLTASVIGHGDQATAQETYRCYSLTSPVTTSSFESSTVRSKSVVSSRPVTRIERRCRIDDVSNNDSLCSARQAGPEVQRYVLNGHRVVQTSTTSFSTTSIPDSRLSGIDFARKIAHDEWIRKKQKAAQRKKEEEEEADRKRQAEIDKLAQEKEEREFRERECFLKWSARKKKEEEKKKATMERQLELQTRLKEIEDKAAVAKALYLRQWARKKKQEEKVRQKKQEVREKEKDEERKKRLEESSKAYEKWRELSKNKPKPATQGLLPHQKAKPAYVNPMPWQRVFDENADDKQEDTSNGRKSHTSQAKISSRKSTMSYQ